MMKITGARWNSARDYYCVDFDDGITLFVNEDYTTVGMISCGPDSYYLVKQQWPNKRNITARLKQCGAWLDRNKNRYKKSKKSKKSK